MIAALELEKYEATKKGKSRVNALLRFRNWSRARKSMHDAFIRGKLKANAAKVEKLWLDSLSAGAKRGEG